MTWFTLTERIFRQINYLVISLVKILGCRDPRYEHEYLDKHENTEKSQLFDRKVWGWWWWPKWQTSRSTRSYILVLEIRWFHEILFKIEWESFPLCENFNLTELKVDKQKFRANQVRIVFIHKFWFDELFYSIFYFWLIISKGTKRCKQFLI